MSLCEVITPYSYLKYLKWVTRYEIFHKVAVISKIHLTNNSLLIIFTVIVAVLALPWVVLREDDRFPSTLIILLLFLCSVLSLKYLNIPRTIQMDIIGIMLTRYLMHFTVTYNVLHLILIFIFSVYIVNSFRMILIHFILIH